ncbi:MAG: TMEM143 family protein [Hyphomicrobium sp.]|nr:TMEM143 family protein [Hyphomicrobium sp.]
MASADVVIKGGKTSNGSGADAAPHGDVQLDILESDDTRAREKFIPLTPLAIVDRLTVEEAWPHGQAQDARRFFRFLDFWRRNQYTARSQSLLRAYEPFNPDSDLLITRDYNADERAKLQKRVVDGVKYALQHANYQSIDPKDVSVILTTESHYGLDLTVDFTAFEECVLFYRGASNKKYERRKLTKFLRKEEFDVPVYQRLFLLFKLKPLAVRVAEVMKDKGCTEKEAEKLVKRLRSSLPTEFKEGNIYMKLFKNIPRTDIEMIFPNTQVKFRLLDKIKLGVTGGGAVGMGVFGTAGKLVAGGLAAANPIALAGTVVTLGGIAFRQGMNFVNQKQRYMVVMAQNLYFHSMADNRGVIVKLAERGAEEDVKEEILLYSVLAKETANRRDLPHIDRAVERYLFNTFGISVDFDLDDALERLLAEGIVTEDQNGDLRALPPQDAARLLDAKWDHFLDDLPVGVQAEGHELYMDEDAGLQA